MERNRKESHRGLLGFQRFRGRNPSRLQGDSGVCIRRTASAPLWGLCIVPCHRPVRVGERGHRIRGKRKERSRIVKFIDPKSYDHLCEKCQSLLADVTQVMEEMGPDTDNQEAPCDWMYDRRLFCGGHECNGEEESSE